MIRIHADIVPYGLEELKTNISKIEIFNDLTGTKTVGNYGYKIFGRNGRIYKRGKVKGHKRANSVWKLLKLVLEDLDK